MGTKTNNTTLTTNTSVNTTTNNNTTIVPRTTTTADGNGTTNVVQHLNSEALHNLPTRKKMNLHLEEYIDPLMCAPRTPSHLVGKIADILDRLSHDNDSLKSLGYQLESYPELRQNTLPSSVRDAELRIAIQRRQLWHPYAREFHVPTQANYSIQEYFKRLNRYFHCSKESFLLAFIYIDRAITQNRNSLGLCYANVHRLSLAAITIACKYWDDIYYSNAHYARVGGLSVKELNNLEYCMLKMLDYKLYVDPDEYKGYLSMLEET